MKIAKILTVCLSLFLSSTIAFHCEGSQMISTNGIDCVNCPPYTRAQDQNSRCGPDQCGHQQFVSYDGRCHNCYNGHTQHQGQSLCPANNIAGYAAPVYVAPVPIANTYSSSSVVYTTLLSCNKQQIRSPDNRICMNCPSYTKGLNNNQVCGSDVCTSNGITTFYGECQECGFNQTPDHQKRHCVNRYPSHQVPYSQPSLPQYSYGYVTPIACQLHQIRTKDGLRCETCPAYNKRQTGSDNSQFCGSDYCTQNQIITINGQCQNCQSTMVPDGFRKSCIYRRRPVCNDEQMISSDGYSCTKCPMYTRAQDGNLRCAANDCSGQGLITVQDGTCRECKYPEYPDSIRRDCIKSQYPTQVPLPQPIVAQSSSNRQNQSNNSRSPVFCNEMERRLDTYSCEQCPPYERAQNYNQYCGPDTCSSNQIVTYQGTCVTCSGSTMPDNTKKACTTTTTFHRYNLCGQNRIMTRLGKCSPCPYGSVSDYYQNECIDQYYRPSMINLKAASSPEQDLTNLGIVDENDDLEVEIIKNNKGSSFAIVVILAIIVLGFTAGSMYFINKVRKMHITHELPESNDDKDREIDLTTQKIDMTAQKTKYQITGCDTEMN